MKLFNLKAILFLLAMPAYGQAPDEDQISIRDVMVRGSGCPGGTAGVMFTSTIPGGPVDFLEVIFDEFWVEKGPGIPRGEKRKFCTIALNLKFPEGFSFAMADVHFEGFAEIPEDSTGSLKTEYYFPHFTDKVGTTKKIDGPFEDDFDKSDTAGVFSQAWSPCGFNVPLNIKTTLQLSGPTSDPAIMTVDQATGLLTQLFHIKWKECD